MTSVAPSNVSVLAKPAPAAAQKRLADARAAVQALAAAKPPAAPGVASPLSANEARQAIDASAKQARLDARGFAKTRARETIERLKKEIELIKRLWAHDAKQMARQLARIGKDLKAAVKDYAKAAKENGEDAAALRQDLTALAASSTSNAPAKAQPDTASENAKPQQTAMPPHDAPSENAASETPDSADDGGPTTAAPAVTQTQSAASAYQTQDRNEKVRELKDRIAEAKGDLVFVAEVRGLIKKIRELMQEAKIKSHFDGRDKADKEEALKVFEKSMADVDEAVGDLETDVRDDFPELSTGFEIKA